MQQRKQSIDGFSSVRRGKSPGGLSDSQNQQIPDQFLKKNSVSSRRELGAPSDGELPRPQLGVPKNNFDKEAISQSLREVDNEDAPKKPRRFRINRKKVALFIVAILLIAGLYFGVKILLASSKLFNGNIFDLLGTGQTLKTDEYGRSNILVFGTSEDSAAHQDAGRNLTDSLMILSIDQEKKNAAMISVPRDLWVEYDEACVSGYEGKINVVYECGSDDGSNQAAGSEKLSNTISKYFGVDIQYYAQVNYTVVRDTVNAVGGVTVEIDSQDPRGVLDRNFDWACNYRCHYVKWPNGPARLDGDQALALARARNAAGGYGLSGGNFDREQYQQKIIVALKDKAASAGTLANPVAVTGIIDALGDNVRTNFSAGEVKTLVSLAGDIPSASIKRVSLVKQGEAVLTTGNMGGQSIVRPVEGVYDFNEVQEYVRDQLTFSSDSTGEQPSIEVYNGSDFSGLAGSKAAELKAAGFSDVSTNDTPTDASYGEYVWYDQSGGKKPKALEKLRQVLSRGPSGTVPPSVITSDADFVIILGNGAR